MPVTLLPLIIQLVQAGITLVPQLIAAAKTELDLLGSNSAPSDTQKAQIDAALELANDALQNAQPAP